MDPYFQKKILDECGRKKNSTAVLFLGKVVSSNCQENRILAIKILNEIGTEKSLEQLMLGYQDKFVHHIINSSFQQQGLAGIEHLIKFAQHKNPIIRFNSMIALGEMGEKAIDPLKRCLSDNNVVLRRIAANALGDLGTIDSFSYLFNAQNDPDDEVRKRANESFAMITQNMMVQDFLDLIHSEIIL